MKSKMQPGDLVRRIVNPAFGLAIVLEIKSASIMILTDTGETKWVFYDALELVEPVQPCDVVV